MEALELFRAGKLDEAVSVCSEQVKSAPTNPGPRDLLSQLYCFLGDFERADNHLKALQTQFADREEMVSLIRQLLRAAEARQQFYREGRVPEFLERPPEYLQHYLQASISIREGKEEHAAEILAQAEQERPKQAGSVTERLSAICAMSTTSQPASWKCSLATGKCWIPFERVIRVVMYSPESPLDILWRRAQIQVHDGPTGSVYLPQLYEAACRSDDELLRVGLAADWVGGEGKPVRGIGHRMLYVDGEARPLNNISALEFDRTPKTD